MTEMPEEVREILRRANAEIIRLRARVGELEPRAELATSLIDRNLDVLEGLLERKAEGNPYHKGSGEGGGQFTSGPSGGSGAHAKPHGKHHAKRQRRKERKKRERKKTAKKSGKPLAKSPSGGGGGSGGKGGTGTASKAGSGTSTGSASSHKMTAKELADRVKKGKPPEYVSEKARRAAENQNKTDKTVQDYTKNNEHVMAKRLGGKSFPDNDPADIHVTLKDGSMRGLELKTLTHGKNDKVTMKGSALARKVGLQKETGNTMYTLVADHRDRFEGGKNKHLYSGNELYLKAGTGSFRVGTMYPVKNIAEAKRLVQMSPAELAKIDPRLKGDTRGTSK